MKSVDKPSHVMTLLSVKLQASGGFDWGNPFGSAGFGGGGSSSSSSSGSRSGRKQQPEEEFYGLNAFFGDIEREWKERRRRRQKEPASLWEELADIGEEFVSVVCSPAPVTSLFLTLQAGKDCTVHQVGCKPCIR